MVHEAQGHRGSSAPWRLPGVTVLLAGLAVAWFCGGGPALDRFALVPTAVREGEWFRVFTGHLVHFNLSHLVWDLAVFVVAAVWIERESRAVLITLLCVASLVISAAVWAFCPHITMYAGLSGLDTALVAFIATGWVRQRGGVRWLGLLTLMCVLGKAGVEVVTGNALFADFASTGVVAVPVAHGAGGLVGFALNLLRPGLLARVDPFRRMFKTPKRSILCAVSSCRDPTHP